MSDHAQSLLTEARRAMDLRRRLVEEGRDTADVDVALERLYRDLGRSIVLSDSSPLLVPDLPTATREVFTSEIPGEDDGVDGWYTDERDTAPSTGPLFDPSDLGDPLITDVPLPDDLHLPHEADDPDATDPDGGYAVETLQSLGKRARDPTSFLGIFRYGVATWKPRLEELLDLLRSPFDLDDPTELGVEASRVQWATTELSTLLEHYPDEVKVALLGLLSSRAQYLRSRLDVDVGARLSLDRLQRYRVERVLAAVPALLPTPFPELGSWLADSEAWWGLFRPRAGSE